ncbi:MULTISPECIES: MFS transporter [unclassified Burkholderia]|uniref:MFS transporter n=1 Tax=unclassified Burkholderia TaxID=2613784 RepID=UPI0009EB0BDC|nr:MULTISPECIES: MFS transporter [unclassified Burkholderia]
MQNKSFLPVLLGDVFANFGSWVDFLAILTLTAYQFQASTYDMAALSTAMLVPRIVLAKRIGRMCDAYSPRTVLIVSLIARIVATFIIIFTRNYWAFLVIVLLRSFASSFVVPAVNSLVKRVSTEDILKRRFSLLNVTNNFAKIFAPIVGTVASQILGERSVLFGSIALSLIGAAFFALAVNPSITNQSIDSGKSLEKLTSASPIELPINAMLPLLICVALYSALGQIVNNQMPLILKSLGYGKDMLGLLVSSAGAGGIVGGMLLASKKAALGSGASVQRVVVPGIASAMTFMIIGVAIQHPAPLSTYILSFAFFTTGFCGSNFAIASNIYLSHHFGFAIGQASSIRQAVQSFINLVVPFAGAYLLNHLKIHQVFIYDGAIISVAFLVIAAYVKMARQKSSYIASEAGQ